MKLHNNNAEQKGFRFISNTARTGFRFVYLAWDITVYPACDVILFPCQILSTINIKAKHSALSKAIENNDLNRKSFNTV